MFNLPLSELKWIPESKLWNALKNPKIHAIFEVDLEYPKDLHEYHKDYPLAPEKVAFKDGEKLCQTLRDKKNYVVYSENLRFYMDMGLKVTKIHRGIKIKVQPFMKPYIENCIELRKASKTEMEKNIWKLMVNAVFGKTMENLRKRVRIEFVTREKIFRKLIANPYF